jgi:hypothetical protein
VQAEVGFGYKGLSVVTDENNNSPTGPSGGLGRYGMTALTPTIDTSGGGFTYDHFKPGNRLQFSLAIGLKIGFGL